MVNKTQFYKTKVALAVVLSLGLAACGDSDGDSSNATSNSVVEDNGGNTLEQVQGSGSVQGTVLDTNGLPVIDATVRLAGQTVVTDSSGYYFFDGVAAPGVNGTNGNGTNVGSTGTNAYTVTITAPTGYADATVQVTAANIQVDSGNNGNDNASQVEASGQQTTWFDGFLAQASTAVLPKFAASVTGVLRDCNTGAALPAGVKVALDYSAISTTVTAGTAQNVTIGVPVFSTTTGEDGSFTFTDIPTDSTFGLLIEGYSLLGDNDTTETSGTLETVSTTGEGIVNNLGTANVCMITSTDNIDLMVTAVSSVVNTVNDGRDWGVLNQGVNGEEGIVISFNEAMLASELELDINRHLVGAVLVKTSAGTAGVTSYISDFTAVLSDNNDSITVTLGAGEGLVEGEKLSIYLPSHNMQDTANNFLDDDADDTQDGFEDSIDGATDKGVYVSLDSNFTSAKATYLRVDLCAYLAPTTSTEALAVTWVIDADDSEDGGQDLLAEYTAADTVTGAPYAALSDGDDIGVIGINNTVVQLNGDDVADTKTRLEELSDAITNTNVMTFANAAARFTLDPKDSSEFDIVINRTVAGESRKLADFNTTNFGAGTASGVYTKYTGIPANNGFNVVAWVDNDTNIVDLVVLGLESGDEVSFVPYDGFGIAGEADKQVSVVVTDVIAPTTVLQESYGLGANGLVYTPEASIGDGGEHVNSTVAVAGNPLLWVTPRLFAGSEGAWDGTGNRAEQAIFSGLTLDRNNDGVADANENVYGQPHYAAKAAVSAKVGVAFSEKLEAIESATLAWDATNAASVISHIAANNLTTDDSGAHSVDLSDNNDVVVVTFDDIMKLANDDDNSAMGFAGAYTDTLGNTARTDAKVVFKDALPPFVTSAVLEADALTITFNEEIDATAGDILAMTVTDTIGGGATAIGTLITGIATTDVTVAANVATIDLTGTGVAFTGLATLFSDGVTTTDKHNFADETAGTVYGHAILDFSNIKDDGGFSWDYYTGTATAGVGSVTFGAGVGPVAGAGRLLMTDAPMFYLTDAIGPFTILASSTVIGSKVTSLDGSAVAGGALGSQLTVTMNLSHPLDENSFNFALPAVVGGNYDLTALLSVGVDVDADGTLDDTFNAVGAEDLLLVGTSVVLDDDATGTGVDHTFLLSADKRTLTLVFKADNPAEQINICTTVMDASVTSQAGITGISEVTSDYNKSISDGNFRLWGASCATPYQATGAAASINYTRP